MRDLLLLAALFVPAAVFGAVHLTEGDNFIVQQLKQRHPKVKWDKQSIKKADINCDGKTDVAILGKEGEKVVVAVVLGPPAKDSIILSRLLVGKHSQDSLCTARVRLLIEDQDYDPSEIFDGEPLPGFRQSKTCKGINVGDGECDSFHYFWNHDLKTIDWWRL